MGWIPEADVRRALEEGTPNAAICVHGGAVRAVPCDENGEYPCHALVKVFGHDHRDRRILVTLIFDREGIADLMMGLVTADIELEREES